MGNREGAPPPYSSTMKGVSPSAVKRASRMIYCHSTKRLTLSTFLLERFGSIITRIPRTVELIDGRRGKGGRRKGKEDVVGGVGNGALEPVWNRRGTGMVPDRGKGMETGGQEPHTPIVLRTSVRDSCRNEQLFEINRVIFSNRGILFVVITLIFVITIIRFFRSINFNSISRRMQRESFCTR